MTEDLDFDIYSYQEFPWISKSTVSAYRFCPHLFKLRYIDKIDVGTNIAMQSGTNMHAIYAKFFDILDYTELKKVPLDYIKPINETKIYYIIYETIMSMIPASSRTYEPYQIMVRNFALLETDHWIYLNRIFKETYSKVLKFFVPKYIEKYLECPALQIFGTVDRGDLYEKNDGITIVYDYKTGWVPIEIVEERDVDPSDPFSWALQSRRNFELHWYIVLDMANKGYTIDEKIVDFCTKRKYFVNDAVLPKVDSYFYDKRGEAVNIQDFYRIGIIYTGYKDRPFVPKKLPKAVSLKTVFKWINKIRTIIEKGGPYNKMPNYFRCRNCNKRILKECLDEEEERMILWGGKKVGGEKER